MHAPTTIETALEKPQRSGGLSKIERHDNLRKISDHGLAKLDRSIAELRERIERLERLEKRMQLARRPFVVDGNHTLH